MNDTNTLPMNILIINHYAGSLHHGMEFRPYYLAREWERAGHRVQILSASYSHLRINQPKMCGAARDETIDGIQYRWFRTPAYEGNGLGRVKNMLAFLLALWRDRQRIVDEFNPDIVIASSTYPMDIWPAHRIAKLAKAKLIFEVHDLWPLSPMELGGMSKWHPFILWVQRAEDFAYRHANLVVSMLPKAQEYMVSRGMEPTKFHYIPNGISLDDWQEDPPPITGDLADHIKAISAQGCLLVGYAGSHGKSDALYILLEAAALLKDQPIRFVLVGNGAEKERLLQHVQKNDLYNVKMFPPIPKSAIPTFLKAIDIAFIGWHRNPLYRFGISPNKLMDYMMAGKPVVHAVEAGNDPVAEAKCGFTVAPGNPAAIHDAILALAAMSPSEREAMGENGKRFILAEQTYPVLAKRFINAIGVA